jgi:hypothetical protein
VPFYIFGLNAGNLNPNAPPQLIDFQLAFEIAKNVSATRAHFMNL